LRESKGTQYDPLVYQIVPEMSAKKLGPLRAKRTFAIGEPWPNDKIHKSQGKPKVRGRGGRKCLGFPIMGSLWARGPRKKNESEIKHNGGRKERYSSDGCCTARKEKRDHKRKKKRRGDIHESCLPEVPSV